VTAPASALGDVTVSWTAGADGYYVIRGTLPSDGSAAFDTVALAANTLTGVTA